MSSTSPSSSSPSTNINVAPPPPDGASCWLCLEEGPDDSGAPLVRNCSCRGSSGFAHLSCIIEYAENMARQIIGGVANAAVREHGYIRAFFKCPNCKQDYQDDLKYDILKAFVAFNTATFPENNGLNKGLLMTTMRNRLRGLDASIETDRIEGEELVSKLLASIEELKKSGGIPGMAIEAHAYADIGEFYDDEASNESMKKARSFYQKARDKYMIMGRKFDLEMREVEIKIGRIESKIRGYSDHRYMAAQIKLYRDKYDCCVEGGNDIYTINSGINLANVLFLACRTIEAERLLGKMVVTSHRIHGPDHSCTVAAVSLLKKIKQRWVSLEGEEGWFEALQHENDGEKCVLKVKGPIMKPRVVDEEQTFEVDSALVAPCDGPGTPVVLYGLKRANHLNGMIGDVRDYCDSTDRFVVHLEGKGLKPVKVKHANLRVVFELPDLEDLD
eukprot:scaffold5837_cov98-Skeletonema_dohrnii-CCMP3373.AAC.10